MENKLKPKNSLRPEIAIIGGSGFYELLEKPEEVKVKTPYGEPSDSVMVGKYKNIPVAFLPRHGRTHNYPPHKIPYKANLYALKKIGVKQILAPCSCGSLQAKIKPGEFVIVDQFVDRTYGRDDTFFHGPQVAHISSANPYCENLREQIIKAGKKCKIKTHPKGTVVVINGPRFSTRSESRWFSTQGWETINMSNYPENVLARELGMCYAAICLVTDYDAGLAEDPNVKHVDTQAVIKTFKKNNEKVKKLLLYTIKHLLKKRNCNCECEIKKAKI